MQQHEVISNRRLASHGTISQAPDRSREIEESCCPEPASDLERHVAVDTVSGARFDSESSSPRYSFSRELLDEWHWKSASSAARELRLPQQRRRQVRPPQEHAVQLPGRGGDYESAEPGARAHRRWTRAHLRVLIMTSVLSIPTCRAGQGWKASKGNRSTLRLAARAGRDGGASVSP